MSEKSPFVTIVEVTSMVFFRPLFSAFFGGISAAIAGYFYSDDILPILQGWGLAKEITLWELGIVFGFFAPYIKGAKQ